MRPKHKKWVRIRIYVTGACFVLVLCVIFLRAYQLQILEGKRLSSLAREDYTGSLVLMPQRGTIFDRNGKELAISIDVSSIYAYPKAINNKAKTARLLAKALRINTRHVLERLRSARSFVWVKRKVTPEEIKKVEELKLSGIDFTNESRRYYACKETAAHVIGFASQDNRGLEGTELHYNSYLEGREIRLTRIHDALGRPLVFDSVGKEDHDPFNVGLTIDKDISYNARKALKKAVEETEAKSGVCIVLRPQTGEILAMAVVPEFNPNIFWQYKPRDWRNRAVTDCYEPGSTLKAFLLAAALEEGVVTPKTIFNCERGKYRIGRYVIHDSKPYGMLRVRDIVKVSSNIGAIKMGQRLGADRFHSYLQRFGFGERSGIDLPGERAGILKPVGEISVLGHNTRYFGQGISTSPLQLAMAFGAIANGGHLMKPFIVKSILDQHGKVIREFGPVVRRDVISPETARTVRMILEDVTKEGGTAPKAAIEGYRVAGKTGTAQKVDPAERTYSDEKFVAFFGGFAPLDSPAVVILVALDEPKGIPYGGIVAAPVFREVGHLTLNQLSVKPSIRYTFSRPAQKRQKPTVQSPDVPGLVPNMQGLGVRDVLSKARRLGVRVIVKGSGFAVEQRPAAGTPLREGRSLTVTFRPPC
jgi:cell division protein FtsI (penicillin-binding protein 3)